MQPRSGRDTNHVTTLMGVDVAGVDTTVQTPVVIGADPVTHRLLVSAVITGGGTAGSQYPETDTTSPATGTLALARYKLSPPTLTDGQMYGLQVDSSGNLKVTGSLSVGGTTDNSAYAAGSGTGTPAMGFYHSTIDTVTDGRAATTAITNKRALHVNLRDSSGNEITALPVTGTFWQTTQPISASSLPLPSGAATAAKQPALGTAGTASSDVITIQGIASMTKLLVTPDSVALPANQSVNISQINAVTPLMGNGVTGTGSQRVTIASDNTAFSVNAIQGTAASLATGWPVINGELSDTSGTFTNATQTTSVTATGLDGYGNVLISINGTYGTATAVFEGSDDGGTTWYGISEADRTDSNVIESGYTSLTNTNRAWQISNPGWDSIRVRSTAVASGTVNVRISPSAAPTAAGNAVSIGAALPTGANTIGAVTIAAAQTIAVTNTGTFATQPVIQTGTNSIGKISDITTSVVPGTAATNLGKAEDAAHTSGDTGVFMLGVANAGASTAFSGTDGDYTPIGVDTDGSVHVVQKAQTATLTNVASSATSVTVLAANNARKGAQFYNDSTQILYLKFGTTASTSSFTVPLAAATYYELPAGYVGRIDGIWASANGNARVTEIT